ncbi:double-stranded RNA-binding protein Staufen homolog isoform X2 [Euwallacea similis]|uniref:double-stranded RNA-binding protein Staufen homolog isoform X2 n=1 Tax=Euwallacea similis TaxID=1736056 RepID=UPI00345057C1
MFSLLFFFMNIFRVYSSTLSVPEILVLFKENECIIGNWLSLTENDMNIQRNIVTINVPEMQFVKPHDIINSDADKSPMNYINELAQYNAISYSYELIQQEGPAHDRTFTVSLYLGDETFTAVQKSIKKAQQNASNLAMRNTKFIHPPVKIKDVTVLTPTVVLNNLAAKLGLFVNYKVLTEDIVDQSSVVENNIDFLRRRSYIKQLNDSIHLNDTLHIIKDGSDTKGPFTVSVEINGNRFFGTAHNVQSAKHAAATKALESLKQNENTFDCLHGDDNCKSNKESIKSPISLVHEAAQKRALPVAFELIDEVGPSHKKMFTTKCTVGDLEATGKGKSKKESKKFAAENILSSLLKLSEVKDRNANVPASNKKLKRKNKKIIKSTFDKINRMLNNFGKSVVVSLAGNNQKSSSDQDSIKSKIDQDGSNSRSMSPGDEILRFGKLLSLQIHYVDFLENGKTYSVLEVGTKPIVTCLGEGINKKNSRDLAASYGIKKLYRMGYLDNVLIKHATDSEFFYEDDTVANKIWLDVIEREEEHKVAECHKQ